MKEAYSVISNLSQDAITILKNNNIQLTINSSDHIPNTEEDILKHVSSPKIIATLSIGLDHIDKEVRESDLVHVINIKDANTISVA